MDLALLHAIDGSRTPFESAEGFLSLLRETMRAAGLMRFAALLADDDDTRALGRYATL